MTLHIHVRRQIGIILLPLALAACAINDTAQPTNPPITLNAPPALVLEGTCDITGELESWLQVTVLTRQEFLLRLNEASAKNADSVYDDTIYLSTLRDTVAGTNTPDCGTEVQAVLTTAMSNAVAALQAYFNHNLTTDLNTALIEPLRSLSQVESIQNELITRMKNQYQLENNAPPTATS